MIKMRFARCCLLIALTGLLFSISGFSPMAYVAPQQKSVERDEIDAGKLFKESCAKCHGKDGRAKTFRGKLVGARNLSDAKWQASVTDEEIREAIRKGPDEMPAFEEKFSEREIAALARYVRGLKQERPEAKKK